MTKGELLKELEDLDDDAVYTLRDVRKQTNIFTFAE